MYMISPIDIYQILIISKYTRLYQLINIFRTFCICMHIFQLNHIFVLKSQNRYFISNKNAW